MDETLFSLIETIALATSALLGYRLRITPDSTQKRELLDRINELAFRMDKLRHEQNGGT